MQDIRGSFNSKPDSRLSLGVISGHFPRFSLVSELEICRKDSHFKWIQMEALEL